MDVKFRRPLRSAADTLYYNIIDEPLKCRGGVVDRRF